MHEGRMTICRQNGDVNFVGVPTGEKGVFVETVLPFPVPRPIPNDARRDNSPGSGAISSSKSLLHICQQNYKKAKGEGNPSPFLFTVYSVSFSRSASMAVSLPRLIS